MKSITVNIVTNNNQYGLSNDASLLVKCLQEVSSTSKKFNFQVRPVSYFAVDCGPADVNIFLEVPNPNLIHKGSINILVPNSEWFYTHWSPYLDLFDFVWCKSDQAQEDFQKIMDKERIINIGWSSLDRFKESIVTDFSKCLHLAGRSELKGTQKLIDNWLPDWPLLEVVYNAKHNTKIKEKNQDNIQYHRDRLTDEELVSLMNKTGIHVCPSEAEGFGHYLNEARSCQSIVLTSDAEPMRGFVADKEHLISIESTSKLPHTIAEKKIFDVKDLERCINSVTKCSSKDLLTLGKKQRQDYLSDKRNFRKNLQSAMSNVLSSLKNPPYPKIPTEIQTKVDDFPKVSVVTLLHNRPKFFPLALMNYLGTDYPRSKLEWIIVDDSSNDNRIQDTLPKDDESIQYFCLDKKTSIAEKRNIGVSKANHDIIAFMDDDDIYQPRHLLVRLAYMDHYKKECSYSSAIGCFHISKLISTMNVPPLQYPPEYRCSEATLTFTRNFWEQQPFNDNDTHNEGRSFLQDRYKHCVEVPFKPIIVSLLHSNNISNRSKNIGDTPNGCHFGLSDDLFKFITSLEKVEEIGETEGVEVVA